MDRNPLDSPRLVDGKPMLIAGLSERFTPETLNLLPEIWPRFMRHMVRLPRQIGGVVYGIRRKADEAGHFDYVAGVELPDFEDVPAELARLEIPGRRYAVFAHRDTLGGVRRTIETIFAEGLTQFDCEAADGPVIERYDNSLEGRLAHGGVEIWVPVGALVPRT